MRKYLSLFVLLFLLGGNMTAQTNVFKTQGVPRPDLAGKLGANHKTSPTKMSKTNEATDFTFDDIVFWVGEGENEAMLVIDWYDDKGPSLVWGYRWDGEATGEDLVLAIAAADPRFSYMGGSGTIGGLGYDINNNGSGCILKGTKEHCPENGIINVGGYDYDGWSPEDETDHWQCGWMDGYWSYQTKDNIDDEFTYSSFGFASRQLTDGCVDGWGYQLGWESWEGVVPRAPFVAALPPEPPVSLDEIVYWVGQGENEAGLAVKWNNGKDEEALVWGYRWEGEKTVIDMMKDIARHDERFFILLNESHEVTIAGIGFDLNNKNTIGVVYNNQTAYPLYPFEGLITITNTDYDKYTVIDSDDHWNAGISENGIWNYMLMDAGGYTFKTVSEPLLSQKLTNGSWNAWNFDAGFEGLPLGTDFAAVSEYVWEDVDYTKGIFFVNEGWFGHAYGSLNFLKDDGEWIYRAYTRENPREALGCTTQFGTIYGDNFYFVSKMAVNDGDNPHTPGGQLVVADAVTLKKKASFDLLGSIGDGRSFLGIDEHTGYIGGTTGIALFNIDEMTISNVVEGTAGSGDYAGQIGTMLRIGDYVFACKQGAGVLVIDVNTHSVVETIECKSIGSIVQSKDGYLWASAYSDGLWKINPYTLEVEEEIAIPSAAQIPGTWGAWTSGVLAASENTNTLYWAKMNGSSMTFFGTKVFKYDIDNDDVEAEDFLTTPFYTLDGYDGAEAFYGSGINLNPETDELVLTSTRTGYGAHYQKNRVHILDAQTAEVKHIYELNDYYWFPAMSVFPDNHAPVVSDELTDITIETETMIFLGDKVSDADSKNAAIIKSIASVSNEDLFTIKIDSDYLIITPIAAQYGSSDIEVKFNSNGKTTTKTITVAIEEPIIPVTSVALNKTTLTLTVGDTETLAATINPEDADNKDVTWTSSNTAVATVDSNGLVTAVTKGEATITVTTADGGLTASCVVTVEGGVNIDFVSDGVNIYCHNNKLVIKGCAGYLFTLYSIAGVNLDCFAVTENEQTIHLSIPAGIYVVKGNNGKHAVEKKIAVK